MRKTALLSVLLTLSLSVWAQTEKGAKLLGGTASIGFEKNYSIYLAPQLGYFVVNNLALGTGIVLGNSKNSYDDGMGNGFRSCSLLAGISPFVRYYLGKAAPTRVFTQANYSLLRSWSKEQYNGGESHTRAYYFTSFGAGVGAVHFITQQVGLEALLAYTSAKNTSSDRNGRVTLVFGLQIYLPAAKQ